jgi:hypothetical protein
MPEEQNNKAVKKLAPIWRDLLETAFIMFLFYSNLLMGEYNRSGGGQTHGLVWALRDIFTFQNFGIGLVLGFIGHWVFDVFRKKL